MFLVLLLAITVARGQEVPESTLVDSYFPTAAETHILTDFYPRSRHALVGKHPSHINARRSMGVDLWGEAHRNAGFARGAMQRERHHYGRDLEFRRQNRDQAYHDYLRAPSIYEDGRQAPAAYAEDEHGYRKATARLGLPVTVDPDRDSAHFKAGPAYFDLISASARLLYTDFQSRDRQPLEEDGWLSIFELTGRAYLDITDNLAITLAGTVYYLPSEGEVGLDLGANSRSFARLESHRRIGRWDTLVYDEFRVLHRVNDLLDPIEVDEIARAGRYRFGRRDDDFRSNQYFDDRSLVYRNQIGVQASTPVLRAALLTLGYDRSDYWRTSDFDDHYHRDRARIHLGHVGGTIPFAPYVSYEAVSPDEWDSIRHRFWHGGEGRLTRNVRAHGRIGYHWNTGDKEARGRDKFLYEGGLVHDINDSLRHSLFGGSIYAEDRFGEDGRYKYLRYSVAHRWQGGNVGRVFAGISDHEDSIDFSRLQIGASLDTRISDSTALYLLTRYEQSCSDESERADSTRWVHEATLSHRLGERLHANITYRYEDYSREGGSFDEHLLSLGLTRTF